MFPKHHILTSSLARAAGIDDLPAMTVTGTVYTVLAAHLNQSLNILRPRFEDIFKLLTSDLFRNLPGFQVSSPPSFFYPQVGFIPMQLPYWGQQKQDNLSMMALSETLPQDLLAGDTARVIKKIGVLQKHKQPVFAEFFYFIEQQWSVISTYYLRQYQIGLPHLSSLKDEDGQHDVKKLSNALITSDHFSDCIYHMIGHMPFSAFHTRYGLGILTILSGKLEILTTLLNPSLHALDAIFLKYILPVAFELDFCSNILLGTAELRYFERANQGLLDLSDKNYGERLIWDMLAIEYQQLEKNFHFTILTASGKPLVTGERCIIRLFPVDQSPAAELLEKVVISNPYGTRTADDEASAYFGTTDYQVVDKLEPLDDYSAESPRFISHLTNPMMRYLMALLTNLPEKKLAAIRGQLGPLLRATFGPVPYLNLPLNAAELIEAQKLWTTQPAVTVSRTLQVYHLTPLLKPASLRFNQIEILAQGFVTLGNSRRKMSAYVYQGSHVEYQLKNVAFVHGTANLKHALQDWRRSLGFDEFADNDLRLYSDKSSHRLYLAANTPVVTQKSRVFYPVAIGDAGAYCSLKPGPNLRPIDPNSNTMSIASGSCMLGNDLLGIYQTPAGFKRFQLLNWHAHKPPGQIIDVLVSQEEHPEEILYLYMQRTLASLYRDAYKDKTLTFYYHDVRSDYCLYLLTYYMNGLMTEEALLKGVAIIDRRHQRMTEKLAEILSPHQIRLEVRSSLSEIPRAVFWETLQQVMTDVDESQRAQHFVNNILNRLATDPTVKVSTRTVYQYLTSQDLNLSDNPLLTLARCDYMAQFAILNQEIKTHLLVALLCTEHHLLEHYETLLGGKFGSVLEFLYLNPFNIRDDRVHNRWYYLEDNIQEANQLIHEMVSSVLKMVHAQAVDSPQKFVKALQETQQKAGSLSSFSFFSPKESKTESMDLSEEKAIKKDGL